MSTLGRWVLRVPHCLHTETRCRTGRQMYFYRKKKIQVVSKRKHLKKIGEIAIAPVKSGHSGHSQCYSLNTSMANYELYHKIL
jgi:nitrogen regulatory protein PII